MHDKVVQLKQHPKYKKALHWGKLLTITGGVQIIVQVTGFVCGILIIRLLPVQEYAFYTLANTMLGTMTVLADGGISAGVMAQGGKVWQDKKKLGAVLATGLNLRKKFAVFSLLISLPILFYLLMHNHASWITATLIVLCLIPAFFAALSDSVLEIVPKLHQSILPLQKNQLTVGVGRLFLSGLTLFLFPWAFLAILSSGIPRMYGNFKLRKITYLFADENQVPDQAVQCEILNLVKRMLPEIVYYCLSAQITIWLISIFGTTKSLASLGALSRFGMITALIATVFSTLVVPRFVKLPNDKSLLYKNAAIIFFSGLLVSIVVVTVSWLFSNQFLWILGNHYNGMNKEFLLIISASCITFIQGTFFAININRGWAIHPVLYISISIITTIIAAFFVDISTLQGVILFNIIISITQMVMFISYTLFRISTIKSVD